MVVPKAERTQDMQRFVEKEKKQWRKTPRN